MQLAELNKLKINVATVAVYNKKLIAIVLRVFLVILTRLPCLWSPSMLLKVSQPGHTELLI